MKTLFNNIRKKGLLLLTLVLITISIFGTSFKKPLDNRKNQSLYLSYCSAILGIAGQARNDAFGLL